MSNDPKRPEQAAEPPGGPSEGLLRRVRWAIWGFLAGAAAIALTLWVQPTLLRLSHADAEAGFGQLVAAVGEERYFEARLTGGFAFGPLRSATRDAGDVRQHNVLLLAAAGELQQTVAHEPSAGNLHAWGAAQLLLGNLDTGIDTLAAAVALDAGQASPIADLGAAYLARYRAQARGDDLLAGLEHVERALAADGENLAALFNRAQALDWLGLRHEARTAWREYLQRESASAWARHATERIATLASEPPPDREIGQILALLPPTARPLGVDLQAIREFVEEQLLGRVVGEVPSVDLSPAQSLQAARAISARLAQLQGDTLLREAIGQLADPAVSRLLRDAFACQYRARQLQRSSRFTDVGVVASRCAELFRAAHSRYAMWPTMMAARSVQSIDREQSRRLTERVATQVDARVEPIIAAWVEAQRGALSFMGGEYVAASTSFEQAIRLFNGAGEHEHAAGVNELMGAALLELGVRTQSWHHYVAALNVLPQRSNSVRWYATRNGVAMAALRDHFPRVATLILTGNAANSEMNAVPVRIAESRRYLAQATAMLGGLDAAHQHLIAARAVLGAIEDGPAAKRTEAELLMAEADLIGDADPAGAASRLHESHRLFALLGVGQRLARVKLFETRALRASSGPSAAIASAEDGLATVEREEAGLATHRQRASFREATAGLYREAIDARAELGDAESAFLHLEQLRRTSSALPDRRRIEAARMTLAPSTVAIVFCVRGRTILRWVVDRDGIVLERRQGEVELESLVAGFRATTLVGGGPPAASTRQLSDLLLGGLPSHALDAQRWIVVPDGVLFRVPFAMLTSQDEVSVLQRREVVVASSLLQYAERHRADDDSPVDPRSAAVFAFTSGQSHRLANLPAAAREAREIAALYGVVPRVGSDASRAAFMTALKHQAVVHFAGHAIVDARVPWRSHLVLAPSADTPSGLLFEQELADETLGAYVVVLAGCSTADGAETQGEGVSSLAKALASAGVPWVIATLSPIADDVAAETFLALHRLLLEGLSPPAAVRALQAEAEKSHRRDAAWSSLVVLGA